LNAWRLVKWDCVARGKGATLALVNYVPTKTEIEDVGDTTVGNVVK